MKISYLFFFVCVFSWSANAQSISGNMNSSVTSDVLFYGNVDVYKGDKLIASVLTDRSGNFHIDLDTGTYRCVVNYAGYYSETKTVVVKKDEKTDFSLKEDATKEKFVMPPPAALAKADYTDADYSRDELIAGSISGGVGSKPYSSGAARVLTAGEINDFSKWNLWQKFTENELRVCREAWKIAPSGRYSVLVKSKSGLPIVDALVYLKSGTDTVYTSRTDNTGKAELWQATRFDRAINTGNLSLEVVKNGKKMSSDRIKQFENGINEFVFKMDCEEISNVDVAFVVDATGSMADEINFFKAELTDIIYESKKISNSLNFRFANVFYRDHGDEYLTRSADFTRVLTEAAAFIGKQNADNGGDEPEAVEVALDSAINRLSWSESAVARVIFLVLDASPHKDGDVINKLDVLIRQAAEKGIRIVPVTSSGIYKDTEYLMRTLAQATNGTYTFLTSNSGIGNIHLEPTTDNYDVETLNDIMIRILKSYTYTPDCGQQIPDLALNYPDSVILVDSQTGPSGDSTAFNAIHMTFYPNPTNGIVHVRADFDVKELYVTDLSGKVLHIMRDLEKNRDYELDLSFYTTGIYLLRYPQNDKWRSGKIVLQRTT